MTHGQKVATFFKWLHLRCAACTGYKRPGRWVCYECSEFAGHRDNPTPEFARLDAACKAHVNAANAFIEHARRVRRST